MTVSPIGGSKQKNCPSYVSKVTYPFIVLKDFTTDCAWAVKDAFAATFEVYSAESREAGSVFLTCGKQALSTAHEYTTAPLFGAISSRVIAAYNTTVTHNQTEQTALNEAGAAVKAAANSIVNTGVNVVYKYGVHCKDTARNHIVYYANEGCVVCGVARDLTIMPLEMGANAIKKSAGMAYSAAKFTVLIPQKIQSKIPTPKAFVEGTKEVIYGIGEGADTIPDLVKAVTIYPFLGPWGSTFFAYRFALNQGKSAIQSICPKVEPFVREVWNQLPVGSGPQAAWEST